MKLELVSVVDFGIEEAAGLLDAAFCDYAIPVHLNSGSLLRYVRRDSVDLECSRVAMVDGCATGAALIARRGWSSRLAAMAILPKFRGMAIGKSLVQSLLNEARDRGDQQMVLEVIESNTPAVRLYQRLGFQTVRRLPGFRLANSRLATPIDSDSDESNVDFREVDCREVAIHVQQHSIPELPWQAEISVAHGPPDKAFRSDGAFVVISDPDEKSIFIRSLIVLPEQRQRGQAKRVLRKLIRHFPDKEWRVPAVCPEEIGQVFKSAGFVEDEISQLQMKYQLTPSGR